ncbi:hypothetical protein ACFX19_015034 [Malus domestica]
MTRTSTKKAMESQNQLVAINSTLVTLLQRFDAMEECQGSSDARIKKLHCEVLEKGVLGLGDSSEATQFDPNLHDDSRTQHLNRQDLRFQPRSHLVKLDFPRFQEGDDPLGWIYKAEHYFDYFDIPADKKVRMASFHMEGETLQWFQWVNCVRNYPKWEDFTKIFYREFGSSDLLDCTENLVKLRQFRLLRGLYHGIPAVSKSDHRNDPWSLEKLFYWWIKARNSP